MFFGFRYGLSCFVAFSAQESLGFEDWGLGLGAVWLEDVAENQCSLSAAGHGSRPRVHSAEEVNMRLRLDLSLPNLHRSCFQEVSQGAKRPICECTEQFVGPCFAPLRTVLWKMGGWGRRPDP